MRPGPGATIDGPGGSRILGAPGGRAQPFRSTPAALAELFGTASAGLPDWHCDRADALEARARAHPVAAVADAYRCLAARHRATAQALCGGAPQPSRPSLPAAAAAWRPAKRSLSGRPLVPRLP